MTCNICNNTRNNKIFEIKEMMFGRGEKFAYMLCEKCGCMQILDQPVLMNKYYPQNYYSYKVTQAKTNHFKNYLIKLRDLRIIENHTNIISSIINILKPASSFTTVLSNTNINRQSSILDVGSGHGTSMIPLAKLGFKITCIDPYIANDVQSNSIIVLKKDIFQMNGSWDLIMMNHVFEHIPNPLEVLQKINELMKPNGRCLLRLPIIPSYAWEKYQSNWVQIDAPRHFFIHSQESLEILTEKSGFRIVKIIHDSTTFQFLGSELYKNNHSLAEADLNLTKNNKYFTWKEIKYFKKKTIELNQSGYGDQAAFILEKK